MILLLILSLWAFIAALLWTAIQRIKMDERAAESRAELSRKLDELIQMHDAASMTTTAPSKSWVQ